MSKKYKPTIRDLFLQKTVSKGVVERSKALDKQTALIMEERKKRDKTFLGTGLGRSKKEKQAIRTALRIGKSPSHSGVKFPRISIF
tara:strand:+ start:1721 stop:1978 length:258 start_codon:yes stop_codon:yes gene_type:complete